MSQPGSDRSMVHAAVRTNLECECARQGFPCLIEFTRVWRTEAYSDCNRKPSIATRVVQPCVATEVGAGFLPVII